MILKNIFSLVHNNVIDLEINKDQISDIAHNLRGVKEIYFENAMVFPGLINSHDHLDFNLFPRLGNSKFKNYTEWGPSIQSTYATEIDEVIQIPRKLRYQWGIVKNLLGGVTTVVHHGNKTEKIPKPITIIDKFQHLHSVHFEKYWKLRLNNPFRKHRPSVIHSGEGIDKKAYNEINDLIQYNFLNKKMIAVHGISMDLEQAKSFRALVWCPQSNEWMFGKTADIEKLKDVIPIVFGTDSTLTSNWNIWTHIRDAQKTKKMTDIELYLALTSNAAELWNLNKGNIAIGKNADMVIAEKLSDNNWEAFFKINPENLLMIIHEGKIVLVDDKIVNILPSDLFNRSSLKPILLNDRIKYIPTQFIDTINEIQKFNNISLPCKVVNNAFTY